MIFYKRGKYVPELEGIADIIVCSECNYYITSHQSLTDTLINLSKSDTVIYFAFAERGDHQHLYFQEKFFTKHFEVIEVTSHQ